MKKHIIGIDILRGLGIFFVVSLHSAFYYFGGIFELDLENPPAIVTVIGLLLMFAGLFAMINGLVHNLQFENRLSDNINIISVFKHQLIAGGFVLVVAYAYFIFTGPGLADFTTKSFDNSFLVEFLRNGVIKGISANRLLYVDSLVMIGTNIILCGLITFIVNVFVKNKSKLVTTYFIMTILFFALSIIRIPLYEIYIKAIDENNMAIILPLNWLVNKNNPIFPFLAFGIFGMWLSSLIKYGDINKLRIKVLPVATLMFVMGIVLYILLPDTMLKRSIDLKWYSIMFAQIGLFSILITGFIYYFDIKKTSKKFSFITKFIYRFGVAGLTVFFLESIVSACVFGIIKFNYPQISFSIAQSLIYGFCLSVAWGLLLILWEKVHYKYGIEYWYAKVVSKYSGSTKGNKLRGD